MGKIVILPETTKYPITLMGERAGCCWGADTTDKEKNYNRGLDCIMSNHGRVMDFVNVEIIAKGYSARVIREWYTHIGCMPARLQSSTRYIDYQNGFDYVTPKSIDDNGEAFSVYKNIMTDIANAGDKLLKLGIPREDCAMILPIGMTTDIVDKRDLRSYVDMSRNRMCKRAYWEFRDNLFNDIINELKEYSDEWKTVIDMLFMPKCEEYGFCTEKYSCGRKPKKEEKE